MNVFKTTNTLVILVVKNHAVSGEFFLIKIDLPTKKKTLSHPGHHHFGLIPKFCCFFVWKASLRKLLYLNKLFLLAPKG